MTLLDVTHVRLLPIRLVPLSAGLVHVGLGAAHLRIEAGLGLLKDVGVEVLVQHATQTGSITWVESRVRAPLGLLDILILNLRDNSYQSFHVLYTTTKHELGNKRQTK